MQAQSSTQPDVGSHADLASLLTVLYLTLCICGALWALWLMVPPLTRSKMKATALFRLSRLASRIARHTAAVSMGRELATGGRLQDYEMAEWLATKALLLDERAKAEGLG
jgi:hypothetical protein